jgi:hypothetical protein
VSLAPEVVGSAAALFDDAVDATALAILGLKPKQLDAHVLRGVLHLKPYTVIASTLFGHTCDVIAGAKPPPVKTLISETLQHHYELLSLQPFVEQQIRAAQSSDARACLNPTTAVSREVFIHGLRLRLGVKEQNIPDLCSCGHHFSREPVFANGHVLTCSHNAGATITTRHNAIVLGIQSVLTDYGIFSRWEPREAFDNSRITGAGLRPDLVIPGRRAAAIDVTVVDSVLAKDQYAVDNAAKSKHDKYDDEAERQNMRFFPIALDTYGRMHNEVRSFCDFIASDVVAHRRPALRQDLINRIAVELLRGNADVVARASRRLHSRESLWW